MDAGCQHSKSLLIDTEKSFQALGAFFKNSPLNEEEKWLTENKIDIVISDVASMPLKAANNLHLPSLLIGNFTWHDIYSHIQDSEKYTEWVQALAEEYSHANLQVLPQCHLNNDVIKNKREVGFIANKGKNIRKKLLNHLGKSAKNKILVFIYLGVHGTDSVKWKNLEDIKDCLFLTRDPVASSQGPLHIINDEFSYHDLMASSDIILTKGGYSTLATTFANHKPVVTCERKDFYEFEAIREYLKNRDIGIIVGDHPFYEGDWQEPIKDALKLTVKNKVPLNGETEIFEIVQQMLS